ncbi:MAG TPA: c-type cytochrome [Thermoanaerobaculia bacterium]
MRVVFPKLIAGGVLVAGLNAAHALSAPQAPQTPAPMPSHEAEQQPPAAAPTPAPESKPAAGSKEPARPNPMRKMIAGHENEPAETVFKNVRVLKGVPAGRFLDTMEGFSHALGTNCKKCHDTENFASDDKEEKKTARGMVTMTRDINEKYIKTIPGMDQDSYVGCNTCHHGQSNPNARPKDAPAEHH